MPTSKYPSKLDSSIEIPAVRDNIVEVGADVLNSLRSAIFQIEKTLGVNPQGAVGNSVSNRIGKSLDGNGNILKEALDRAGVLSGPISDADVSRTAAIDERKLRLDYPTQLLQQEISQVINKINLVLKTIEELSVLFRAHVHPDAINRHTGNAISIKEIGSSENSIGMTSLAATTAQNAFEDIFTSHINYDGSNISTSNRSHEAEQIFFDKTDVSVYVSSDDVQGAIEDVLAASTGQLTEHQYRFHDNSIIRSTKHHSQTDASRGDTLLSSNAVNYTRRDANTQEIFSTVNFTVPPEDTSGGIKRSDILEITTSNVTTAYQIFKVTKSGSRIQSVEIFGRLTTNSDTTSVASIYRNLNQPGNRSGLLCAVREEAGDTDASIVQVANPDAATIITAGIKPSEITLTNRYFKISIDGGSDIQIDTYDATASKQSVGSIAKKINEAFAEGALSVLAYRVDYEESDKSEIAIVHSLASDVTETYTIKISGDSAPLASLGMTNHSNIIFGSGLSTTYYINGNGYEGFSSKMDETGTLDLLSGTPSITSTSYNFIEAGISKGDVLVITGTDNDNGTYKVVTVQADRITVDYNQLSTGSWAGLSKVTSRYRIFNNTAPVEGLAFDKVSAGSKAALIELFIDTDRKVLFDTALEYPAEGVSGSFSSNNLLSIVDYDGDIHDKTMTLSVTDVSLSSSPVPSLSLDSGPPVTLESVSDEYIRLYSGLYDISLVIYIEDSAAIASRLSLTGPYSIAVHGNASFNSGYNYLLSRIPYESAMNRVVGHGPKVPRIFEKSRRGSVGYKDLGTDVIYKSIQRPTEELRSNGVISGLELSPNSTPINGDGYYTIDVSAGTCYVLGKRFDFDKHSITTDIISIGTSSVDMFYVAIDRWGNTVFRPAITGAGGATCCSPFNIDNYCIVGVIEYDGITVRSIDLRLFITHLDFKVLNAISVSPTPGLGHFTSINKAVKYAKRFSKIFPNAGAPTIHLKSGTHRINIEIPYPSPSASTLQQRVNAYDDQGIWINFPVNIVGEGNSTIVDITRSYTGFLITSDNRATKSGSYPENKASIYIAGSGLTTVPAGNTEVLTDGFVNLRNFRMRMSGISILDPEIENSSGHKLNFGINIDNVIFDETENPRFEEYRHGPILESLSSSTSMAGNINISNCQFLNSLIYIDLHSQYCKNINILNNVSRGTALTTAGGENNYLIYQSSSHGSIFDIHPPIDPVTSAVGAPMENNINIIGNISADFDSSSAALHFIDSQRQHRWGDRLGAGLSVARNLTVGVSTGDLDVSLLSAGHVHFKAGDSGATTLSNNADNLVIEGDGHSGISILTPDADNQNIYLGSSSYTTASVIRSHYNSDSPYLGLGTNHSSGTVRLWGGALTDGSPDLAIRSNGKVGIKTLTPDEQLHIYDSGSYDNCLRVGELGSSYTDFDSSTVEYARSEYMANKNSHGVQLVVQARDSADSNFQRAQIGTQTNHPMSFLTNNSTRLTIEADGDAIFNGTDKTFTVQGGIHCKDLTITGTLTASLAAESFSGIVKINDSLRVAEQIQCGRSTLGSSPGYSTLGPALYATDDFSTATSKTVLAHFDSTKNVTAGIVIDSSLNYDSYIEMRESGTIKWSLVSDSLTNDLYITGNMSDGEPQLARFLHDGGLRLGNTTTGLPSMGGLGQGLIIRQQYDSPGDGLVLQKHNAEAGWAMYYGGPNTFDGDYNGQLLFTKRTSSDDSWYGHGRIDHNDPGVDKMNFTGQHRCAPSVSDTQEFLQHVGKIVVSSGNYKNFESDENRYKPNINQSLPLVSLASSENQKSVFGVISNVEDPNKPREYSSGNFVSILNKPEEGDDRIFVNSVGEGAIWICNINGDLENGDYITTCEVPGYGMKQDDDVLHNYTVAKITCDCDFDLDSNIYECYEFTHDGKTYRKAFVGCTYHCG